MEPPPSPWWFPSEIDPDEEDLVAVGADLSPGTLLAAYRAGYFPMPLERPGLLGWWSPDPRGVIELDDLRVSRSLRRSLRRYEVTVDAAFDAVMEACADPGRLHGWIDRPFRVAYGELHRLGWAHSVECWEDGRMVGGLYGVSIGGFFAGESMFHHADDASKVALVALVDILRTAPTALLDVQWVTPHLASLGARPLARPVYLSRLPAACASGPPDWLAT